MLPKFTCLHCGNLVPRNPQIKNQKYCSSRECQNARRCLTNKARARRSSESRSLRQARNARWRDNFPSHQYQKEYREKHPQYVARNGQLQRERNKRRQRYHSSMIVKTYALLPRPLRDGIYTTFSIKGGKIVKTYALLAQMQAITKKSLLFAYKSG